MTLYPEKPARGIKYSLTRPPTDETPLDNTYTYLRHNFQPNRTGLKGKREMISLITYNTYKYHNVLPARNRFLLFENQGHSNPNVGLRLGFEFDHFQLTNKTN